MGNSVSLHNYLLSSSSSDSDNDISSDKSSESEDTPERGAPQSNKTMNEEGSAERGVTSDQNAPFSLEMRSRHEGGRLWEVTPVQFDNEDKDNQLKSALKVREFGTSSPPQTNGLRVRGLAPVGDPLTTNDEIDDVDHGKMNPFTIRKLPNANNSSRKKNTEERVYSDSRLPSGMDDMPTIYEHGSNSGAGPKRKKRSRDDNSAALSRDDPSDERGGTKCRKVLRFCMCLFVLFLILAAIFLYFYLREDDDDNDTRGTEPISGTPTVSPVLGRLFVGSSVTYLGRLSDFLSH